MAPPPGTLRVGRYFLALLALLAVLYAIAFFPGKRHTPRLGIDLVGGLRVLFTAQVPKGSPPPTSSQMNQARQILEDRINSTGVTNSTVVVQGSNQLVVEIPNGTSTDVARLGKAAILNFRGLMAPQQQVACVGSSAIGGTAFEIAASPTVTTSTVRSAFAGAGQPLTVAPQLVGPKKSQQVLVSVPDTASSTLAATKAKTVSAAVAKTLAVKSTDVHSGPLCAADPFAAVVKKDASLKALLEPTGSQVGLNAETCPSPSMPTDRQNKAYACHGYATLSTTQQSEITGALQNYQCSAAQVEADRLQQYYLACDTTGTVSYLLGHVVVQGKQIDSASAQAPSANGQSVTSTWSVALTLSGSGADKWNAWTSKYNTKKLGVSETNSSATQCSSTSTPCSLFVGFTLDGAVISLPITNDALSTNTSISGSFTQSSADDLAQELNYGKLPISFHVERNDQVSATLGTHQLHAAFLAGGIGLALVVLYSLIYYRGLGTVTIASLIVSAGLTYAMLVLLSRQIGFNLDLAGIAGFIVALGITADSFVVFFERIKDEVHEGRSLRVAVPRAWVRARRTILSADTVSFLAAAILYYFAAADVKGFAFTLGLSTILDLVVVFLFTHPMVSLLSRSRAFGSPRFTGLNHVRAGGIATTDDEALPARKRPRLPRRPVRASAADEPGAVAVLDEDEAETVDDEVLPAEPEPDAVEDGAPRERRRTAPAPGTAAERAAARRARMREAEGKGDR